MYQSEWYDGDLFVLEEKKNPSPEFTSKVDKNNIKRVLFSHWDEHCLECGPPLCYKSCAVYLKRGDKKCRKVYYGIARNRKFSGLFSFGADVRFRKWGNITATLFNTGYSPRKINALDSINKNLVRTFNFLAKLAKPIDKTRKINNGYAFYRTKILKKLKPKEYDQYDDFLIECYSFEQKPFRLMIENNKFTEYSYRDSVLIQPGYNLHRIPVTDFRYRDNIVEGAVIVFPENDLEARIVFTWLDFVQYKIKPKVEVDNKLKPATKVKCVAWDLDNTFWKGVFIENKPENLVINSIALDTIKKLDERGILNTIVSKNTYEEVWPFIESLGISEYFLFPAINWGQKSENLKKIADYLNINVDTFALIDDSPFERSEVSTALTQVRVYKDTEISKILGYPEFDVPVTEESRKRRSYYLIEQKRVQIAESFTGDYHSFLKSCQIKLNIFVPETENQRLRCFELIQRTNQLNLSSRRYNEESFNQIFNDDRFLKVALEIEDQFGSYGIVGFSIIEKAIDYYKIQDFVISCRVANKLVEDSFVTWLSNLMRARGKRYLLADYIKTTRNGKMLSVFEAIKFEKEDIGNDTSILKLDLEKQVLTNDVIIVSSAINAEMID